MHLKQKNSTKTLATVLMTVVLVISGFFVLLSAKAMPNPDGPVITTTDVAK